jgi:hypothetical protein
VSTSGVSPVTVTFSWTLASLIVIATFAFWPTSSSSLGTIVEAKPERSACSL